MGKKETSTQRKRRLAKKKLKRLEKLANESDEAKRQRLSKRRYQDNSETHTQRQLRLDKAKKRMQLSRAAESQEEHDARIAKIRQYMSEIRGSVQQREVRLSALQAYDFQVGADETPEQREVRLSALRAYDFQVGADETPEQREVRLSALRAYDFQVGADETPEQQEVPIKNKTPFRTKPKAAFPEDAPSTSNTNNAIEIKITIPEPLELPAIKTEIEDPIENYDIEIIEHDIKQELAVDTLNIPTMENPFSSFEPSYLNPDISKAVILKSILTRKSPIKKDMSKDSFAFNSGMDLLRPLYGTNQADLNPPMMKLEPKIMNTTTLAKTETCLFCNKKERKIGTQREFSSKSEEKTYEKVLSFAKGLNDDGLLEKLKDAKTFSFHPLCRTEYRNKYEKLTRKNCDEQDWLVFKNLHAEAFESLCAFIDDKIVDKHKTFFLSDLHERYKALLYETQNSSNPFDFESYSPQNLQEKIVNRYYGIIDVTTSKVLKRKIIYKSDVTTNFSNAVVENEDQKYDKLAFELRSAIKSMKRGNSESENNQEIPEKLFRFVGSLIQGPDVRKMNSYEDCLKIKSMCEDIVDRITKED